MISGSGAEMQSTSYFPAYYHILDQSVAGSGSLWQVLTSGTTCKLGVVYNVLPESSDSGQCLAYNKEILRQTMLKHETIFRNQVHELHRLYGRQRELMNEISRNHWQFQTSQSNLIRSQMQCDIYHKALHVQCPSAQRGENFQMPSTFVSQKCTQAGSRTSAKQNATEEQRVLISKSYYSGKKMLDLELPAQEYIDSEDEEVLEDRNNVQMPQVQYDHFQSTSPSPTKNDLKLNEASSSNGSSNCGKTTFLFDLNEPIQLDESENPKSANLIDFSTEIMPQGQDSFGKSKSDSPVQKEESTYNVLEGKGTEGSSLISGLQNSTADGSPLLCGEKTSLGTEVAKKENETFDDKNQSMICSCITHSCSPVLISSAAKTEASTLVSSQHISVCDFGDTPFAIQALPCFNNPDFLSKTSRSSTSNSGIKRKYCNSKGNPVRFPSLRSVSCCITGNSDNEHAAEHSSLADCIKNLNHTKSSNDMVLYAMPHSCLSNPVVSQEKHIRTDEASSSENSKRQLNWPKPEFDGTKLETPLSPDNKEHLAVKSEENEMPYPTPKQKTGDQNEDSERIAAEAIVSISSLDIQQCLKNDKIVPLEVSTDCCLSWFAGVVSSVTSEQEIESLLNDASSSDHNVLARDEIGHIEVTLFKFDGINVEECCTETSNQKSKTISGIMMPSHPEEKGRARKKKGSLSCIGSLCSSNMTENLEPTEQLIMAAGSTSRRTITGPNDRARRSRSLKMVSSDEIERKICSILKQHTRENELSFTLEWGRKNRRQKSRQARANYCVRFD